MSCHSFFVNPATRIIPRGVDILCEPAAGVIFLFQNNLARYHYRLWHFNLLPSATSLNPERIFIQVQNLARFIDRHVISDEKGS